MPKLSRDQKREKQKKQKAKDAAKRLAGIRTQFSKVDDLGHLLMDGAFGMNGFDIAQLTAKLNELSKPKWDHQEQELLALFKTPLVESVCEGLVQHVELQEIAFASSFVSIPLGGRIYELDLEEDGWRAVPMPYEYIFGQDKEILETLDQYAETRTDLDGILYFFGMPFGGKSLNFAIVCMQGCGRLAFVVSEKRLHQLRRSADIDLFFKLCESPSGHRAMSHSGHQATIDCVVDGITDRTQVIPQKTLELLTICASQWLEELETLGYAVLNLKDEIKEEVTAGLKDEFAKDIARYAKDLADARHQNSLLQTRLANLQVRSTGAGSKGVEREKLRQPRPLSERMGEIF